MLDNSKGEQNKPAPLVPLAYNIRTAATLTGLGYTNIWRRIQAGELEAKRIGGKWIIPHAVLQKFVS